MERKETDPVPGSGPQSATWAIVGEAPGAAEASGGRPFIGPSGKLLRDTLRRVGLDPDEAYITNVVKVRPPGNATPGPKEIEAAAPALRSELEALPNLRGVLAVGNVPLQALTGLKGVTKNRGLVEGNWDTDIPVFSTLHPAAVLRNQNHLNTWIEDLARFQQIVELPMERVGIHVVDDDITFAMFKAVAVVGGKSYGLAALDIETTWGQDQLVCVGVTYTGGDAWIFPAEYVEWARPYLEAQEWIMHNGSFDVLTMRKFGFNLKLKHDTMAMAFLINEAERKGLQWLSSVYLGLPPYKDVDYQNILDEPFEKVALMNGRDVCRTFNLYRPLADKINEDKALLRLYAWLLMPAVRALIDVTTNGIPVDEAYLDTLREELNIDLERAAVRLNEFKEGINPRSPKQVGELLFDELGLEPVKYTDTGAPSTDAESVTEMLLDASGKPAEVLQALLDYRKISKQVTSYGESWPQFIQEGRMHPRYKPLHVVTGRLSSENPNIQQVPREPRFRNVFRAPEGHSWVKADYSQIELRLAAWIAEEEKMLDAYYEGLDLHTQTAILVLRDDSPSARQVGKTLNFGLLYGAGAKTLQRIARMQYGVGLDLVEAREYRTRFFLAYPGLRHWHRRVENAVTQTGVVRSPLGRMRHLPDAQSWDDSLKYHAVRQAINHPVQSMASDLLLVALSRVNEAYPGMVVAEVHDEIDLVVPSQRADEVAAGVKEIMEDLSWLKRFGIQLGVPVLSEVKSGPSWGDID
jgi:uracil-DNA glycosylase family 4